jgi:hypothetical protein
MLRLLVPRTTGADSAFARAPSATGLRRARTRSAVQALRCKTPPRSRSRGQTGTTGLPEPHPTALFVSKSAPAPKDWFRTSKDRCTLRGLHQPSPNSWSAVLAASLASQSPNTNRCARTPLCAKGARVGWNETFARGQLTTPTSISRFIIADSDLTRSGGQTNALAPLRPLSHQSGAKYCMGCELTTATRKRLRSISFSPTATRRSSLSFDVILGAAPPSAASLVCCAPG